MRVCGLNIAEYLNHLICLIIYTTPKNEFNDFNYLDQDVENNIVLILNARTVNGLVVSRNEFRVGLEKL